MPQKPLPRSIHLTRLPAAPTSPVLIPRNPMSLAELSLCPSIVSQWPLLCLHPSAPHSHLPLFTPTSTQTRRLVHTSIHFATQLLATSRTCIFTCMNWLASPQPEADSSQPPPPPCFCTVHLHPDSSASACGSVVSPVSMSPCQSKLTSRGSSQSGARNPPGVISHCYTESDVCSHT